MHYVYILKSTGKNWYYVGSSSDLQNRLQYHQDGKVRSTASKRPLKLIYYEAYESVDKARSREKEIKSKRSEKEKIIERID